MANYVVGFNMPGYMPESEPAEYDNFADALEALIANVQRALDDMPPDDELTDAEKDECEELSEAVATLGTIVPDRPRDIGFTIGKWHYFLSSI